jgi:5,10-methylene-tetrahydrofolate dehydrogenase/methenyl tetrahydrofolate cyclohydrolase
LLADEALRHAERLFLIGYSLPEADLTMRFLLDRADSKSTVVVVDRSTSVGKRIKSLLAPRNVDLTFTGRDSVVEEFVQSYVVIRDGQPT